MEVDMSFEESMLRKLKIEDPWLPPKPWESLHSVSSSSSSLKHTPSHGCVYDISSVSEASLVRLVMNALQGVQSAVVSIEHLSALFCADSADRSVHRIPTLWSRSLSTSALGKMLKSIGFAGSLVVLLYKFVDYFTCSSFDGSVTEKQQAELEAADDCINDGRNGKHPPYSLVNQAFGVAVRTVLEGYMRALDTLSASVHARRSFNNVDLQTSSLGLQGNLAVVSHSEVTLLEVYLHSRELRTQIEGLGHLCLLHDATLCFSLVSFEDLTAKAVVKIRDFPKGGNLLTYLYTQLQVVDPAHCSLLKYLFLRSLEPYCGFIRSWIYEAKINDPYGEFVVEYGTDPLLNPHGKVGVSADFPLTTVRERDGVDVPCFLKSISVPLLRAGQQLQVVMKLFRLCNYVHAGEYTFEDILPGLSDIPSHKVSSSPLFFKKEEIEAIVLSRRNFYSKMHEKLEIFMDTLDIKHRQVVLHDGSSFCANDGATTDVQHLSSLEETLICRVDGKDSNKALQNMDSEASSMDEDFSFASNALEDSDYSSTDDLEEQDSANSCQPHDSLACSNQRYLSALCFSSLSHEKSSVELPETSERLPIQNTLIGSHTGEPSLRKYDGSCREQVELSSSWVSEVQYANIPNLGWPVGGLLENPLSTGKRYRDKGGLQLMSSNHDMTTLSGKFLEELSLCSSNQTVPRGVPMHEIPEKHIYNSSNSFLRQSWNCEYPCNMLSVNPMFMKNAFLHDENKSEENKSIISRSFHNFDFSSTTNPFEVDRCRLSPDLKDPVEPKLTCFTVTPAVRHAKFSGTIQSDADNIPIDKDYMVHAGASLNLESDRKDVYLKNVSGGSSWQSMLHGSLSTGNVTVREPEQSTEAAFQIPLDFIIDKCLLQEIVLQYVYVSRLSIKLLEGGFDLQEHFLALRRYHFMEIADWADLFITSLWHHKWYFTEADQKIPEIQGLLESSIQRSSCERDNNKDRLYVYVKDLDLTSFSTAAVGIHTYDFIGLGYRVDWPVSIILTPTALRIYADIFTFLIQVKLAVLSLSDVWCSLKGFRLVLSQNNVQHQLAKSNFNYLVKLRHQVNHFVFTLQQYVLSQLSHVSWCRFHCALGHEVKDMMDLESVHMAYLTDSMHIYLTKRSLALKEADVSLNGLGSISLLATTARLLCDCSTLELNAFCGCFLADETRSISGNIESILQCALDFRSCLVKGLGDVRSDNLEPVDNISQINISQALSLKEKFYKNLKELQLTYLKSTKHGEFGLPRFWSYLNYNEYYSDALGNEICHYNILV